MAAAPRLFQAGLERLLPAVRAREPDVRDEDVVPVVVRVGWTPRGLEPAVLVLEQTAARLWREGLAGQPVLEVELEGDGWTVELGDGRLVLQGGPDGRLLVLGVPPAGAAPRGDDRARRHRVAGALERALGPAPDEAPRVVIDRAGPARPHEVVIAGLSLLGVPAFAAAFVVGSLRFDWLVHPVLPSVAVVVALVVAAWLWFRYQRGRDGWVALYPDRVVHIQDCVVVVPWRAVRGFDDRPSSWVTLDCRSLLSIPTVDEAARTAVLAALDAAGLRRSG